MNEASKEPPGNQERAKPIANRRSGGSSVSCPPYKPGLQQLVEGKQAWADPLGEEAQARGFLGWHQRGYLPHRDAPGLRQFVTFRLHDSFPASQRGEWAALLRIEDDRQRRQQLEEYLDRGYGECWLREAAIAGLVREAKNWAWSSARFRDDYGKLVLPPEAVSRLEIGAPPGRPERRLAVGLSHPTTHPD